LASEQPAPEFLKPRSSGGLDRWALVILVVAVLLLPFIVYGAIKGKKIAPTDIRKLLPTNFEEAQVYDQFKSRFGVDEMIVASWDTCVIDNPAVLEFQDALAAARDEESTSPAVSKCDTKSNRPIFRHVSPPNDSPA